jgi:phosphoacetylglucosamine mutase
MESTKHRWEEVKKLDAELYQVLKKTPKYFTYGTSGFRYDATEMKPISLRVGLFMDYLAKYFYPQALGIVISASHNPKEDNGLKLINPEGEMLDWKFESCMDKFINCEDLDKAFTELTTEIDRVHDGQKPSEQGIIFIARDTRKSGPELHDAITRFATSKYVDFGELSTPILYFLVAHYNEHREEYNNNPTVELAEAYFKTIKDGFQYNMDRYYKKKRFNTILDCANGVGAKMIENFRDTDLFKKYQTQLIYNSDWENLNVDCGADWVHKYSKATSEFKKIPEHDGLNNVCFVLDGDADRSVFYLRKSPDSNEFLIGDGNRICVLFARVLAHFRTKLQENRDQFDTSVVDEICNSKVGVVYTAYSNSAYVQYAQDVLKLGAEIAKTGVKFVHAKAKLNDIGIYFESNGHGTIIYKHKMLELLKKASASAKTPEAKLIAEDFLNYLTGQNNVNGDAISNVLLILSSIEILDIDIHEIFTCYIDNLALTSKVSLRDRTLLKSTEDERILAKPEDIQPQVDIIMKDYPGYIGFVRGSGTEDVCRIYVEGKEEAKLKELESRLKKLISEHPLLR